MSMLAKINYCHHKEFNCSEVRSCRRVCSRINITYWINLYLLQLVLFIDEYDRQCFYVGIGNFADDPRNWYNNLNII